MKATNRLYKFIPLTILILLLGAFAVFGEGDGYNSASDPIVTYSYVNQILKAEIKREIIAELSGTAVNTETNETKPDPASVAYEVVNAKYGQQIVASAACELILRSGKATAISPSDTQGLSDLSASKELLNGNSLERNHYLIIPRGDGRGVSVTSDEAYFMIRGEYKIVG